MENMRVAITGGAGFIGANLARELATNNTVIIVDDLSTGSLENIADVVNKEKGTFIHGSILDLDLLEKAFNSVDFIFHHAAITSVPQSADSPQASHEANITGTLNVLLAARYNHVSKVVFASSSAVYGDSPVLPKREDVLPSPQSLYAATKLAGEYYCLVFQKLYGLPTVCLRYFNVYGPRQDPNSEYAAVIPKFITSSLQGKPLIVYGDGKQTRDFVFIKDVVRANIWTAESNVTGIFNIGSGQNISINRLADLVIEVTNSTEKRLHKDPRAGDIRHSFADISKAMKFGYKSKHSLETGLTETVKWFGERISRIS